MTTEVETRFGVLDPPVLEAYMHQKAADLQLPVPAAFAASVLETLDALQEHTAILEARLAREDAPAHDAAS